MHLHRVDQTKKSEASPPKSTVTSVKFSWPTPIAVHPILQIQQTIGNRAVQRLLRSRTIQAKLSISHPSDIYEQKADRVAEQVMRMPELTVQRACSACAAGASTCSKCDTEKQRLVQRKTEHSSDTGKSVSDNFLHDLGPGRRLDDRTRAFFEPRLGHDFSEVRVHADAKAAESARAVNALAYTVGRNVVFGSGQYAPGTSGGRLLLAHELAHVVQQGAPQASAPPAGVQIQRREEQSFPIAGAPRFPGCSPYERFRLDQQVSRAHSMVRAAETAVADEIARPDRATGIITIAGSAINRYFHTSEKRHIRTVLTRLQRIGDRLGRSPQNWRCLTEAGCRDQCNIGAAACTEPGLPVFICPIYFIWNDTDGAFALIHEAAHQAGMGLGWGVQGEIYEREERFARLTTGQALDTPDSYQALVRDVTYGGGVRLSASSAWTPFRMSIGATIVEPALAVEFFISRLGAMTRFPNVIPAGTVVENRFRGVFIFDAGDEPRRPTMLANPEVSLKIFLRRSEPLRARLGRPGESMLFDRAGRVAPNEAGRMIPPGTARGYEFDFSFDTADRGALHVVAQIRDEDAGTTLTYRDQALVRPTAAPGSGPGTPSPTGVLPAGTSPTGKKRERPE